MTETSRDGLCDWHHVSMAIRLMRIDPRQRLSPEWEGPTNLRNSPVRARISFWPIDSTRVEIVIAESPTRDTKPGGALGIGNAFPMHCPTGSRCPRVSSMVGVSEPLPETYLRSED